MVSHYIDISDLNKMGSDFSKQIVKFSAGLLNQVLQSAVIIFNTIVIITLTPIIIFYFLNDWEKICSFIDELIPRKYYNIVKLQMEIINQNIAGYIRGQLKVCLLLGLFYSIALTLAKVEYSLFIGITTGVLSFIPYVGTIFGLLSSHLVAIYQFNNIYNILVVTLIFIIGQLIESFILTPRLIGNSVNLHPVWVIFAIILGAKLFGFIGVLLSIPVASTIAVLIRLLIKQYKNSKYYGSKAVDINQ
jgi:predicted PurR-regulated permease PerM